MSQFWQDLEKTIPAKDGDPVRVYSPGGYIDGMTIELIAPSDDARPTRRGDAVEFDGVGVGMSTASADDEDAARTQRESAQINASSPQEEPQRESRRQDAERIKTKERLV